ncbi:Zonular occludens toxin (Zot) [compost metagenome]
MISFYSGTPGSGKSLQMAHTIEFWIKKLKKNVITSVPINRDYILLGREGGRIYHFDYEHMTVDNLYMYALKFHKIGVESQTLIVIDEAQFKFSPTACKLFCKEDERYRQDWLEFFSNHRHLGYDIILISQFDKLIDPQIRCLFEYNYKHRKANNFKTFGQLLTIFRVKMFVQIQYWYGSNDRCSSKIFFYRKKYSKIYDSYGYRNIIIAKLKVRYGEEFVNQLISGKNVSLKNKETTNNKDNKKVVNL